MKQHAFFTYIFSLLALAGLLLAAPAPAQARTLSGTSIHVTTTSDELSNNGACSLREALRAANTDTAVDSCPAGSGDDVIYLPTGTFKLTLTGAGEDLGMQGDLDIDSSVTIIGTGKSTTILDGNATDRVFHIIGKYNVNISYLTIRNGNTTETGGGGGIYNYQGSLNLFQVMFSSNVASNTGGGLSNNGAVILRETSFIGNSAKYGGGAYNSNNITIANSTFSNNTASRTGGGLHNGGFATLNNTTVSVNISPGGGGVFSDNYILSYNNTFTANNLAISLGGGEMRFWNTVVANSTDGPNCDRSSGSPATFLSLGGNLDSGNSCFFLPPADLIDTDPLLGPLQDNGGTTLTHALLTGSPAIDSGDNNSCLALDQRGRLRPADGDENGSSICDVGSFEYNGAMPYLNYLPTALKR